MARAVLVCSILCHYLAYGSSDTSTGNSEHSFASIIHGEISWATPPTHPNHVPRMLAKSIDHTSHPDCVISSVDVTDDEEPFTISTNQTKCNVSDPSSSKYEQSPKSPLDSNFKPLAGLNLTWQQIDHFVEIMERKLIMAHAHKRRMILSPSEIFINTGDKFQVSTCDESESIARTDGTVRFGWYTISPYFFRHSLLERGVFIQHDLLTEFMIKADYYALGVILINVISSCDHKGIRADLVKKATELKNAQERELMEITQDLEHIPTIMALSCLERFWWYQQKFVRDNFLSGKTHFCCFTIVNQETRNMYWIMEKIRNWILWEDMEMTSMFRSSFSFQYVCPKSMW